MQNQPEIIVSDVHRTLAAEVISKQVVTGTKRNYANAISLLEKWLQDHYPTSLADNPFADGSRILLPISVEVITAYMASIQRRDEQGRYVTTGGKLIAVSTMNTVKSAVNNLYRVRKVPVDEALRVELKNFMAGHRRMVASAKENGELNIFEGKRPLTFDGYYNLAEYALKKQNFRAGSLYAHLFVVLSWNLFARSHSVASLMLNHFEWQDDALLVTLPRHKGDQEGTRMFPVHVYANPDKPVVCPILALAIHIFSTQTHVDNDSSNWKLFSGSSVEGKFSNWLQNLLQTNQFNETSLGASKTELGTHSFRKGGVTYVLSFPGGPSPVAAYLRARWSLGAVQQRYVFEGEGADQLCGRTAAGLPIHSIDFAVLPPHFPAGFTLSDAQWNTLHSDYGRFPRKFRTSVMPYLLASLVYHRDKLRDLLDASHPLFCTPLFTSSTLLAELSSEVAVGRSESKINMSLKATGIPPHLSLIEEIYNVLKEVKDLGASMTTMKSQLHAKLNSLVEDLPQQLSQHLLSNFQIEGAIPITFGQVQTLVTNMQLQIMKAVENLTAAVQTSQQPADTIAEDGGSNDEHPFILFEWENGTKHMVPEDFVFHAMNVKALWSLWFHGNPSLRIGPLKGLSKADLVTNASKTSLVRARKVIKTIWALAGNVDIEVSNVVASNTVFAQGFSLLKEKILEHNPQFSAHRRWDELLHSTLYSDIQTLYKNGHI